MQRRKAHHKRGIYKRKRPGGSPSGLSLRGKTKYIGGDAGTLTSGQVFETVRSIMTALARNLGRERNRIIPKEENHVG